MADDRRGVRGGQDNHNSVTLATGCHAASQPQRQTAVTACHAGGDVLVRVDTSTGQRP